MIIAEGPDGAGKTTLLGKFAERTGREIRHVGGPPKTADEIIERMSQQIGRPETLHDRTPLITELIYWPLRNDECLLSLALIDHWVNVYRGAGAIIIYCRPDTETIREIVAAAADNKAHKPKEHLAAVKLQIDEIVGRYDRTIHNMTFRGLSVYKYDRDVQNAPTFIDNILTVERRKNGEQRRNMQKD